MREPDEASCKPPLDESPMAATSVAHGNARLRVPWGILPGGCKGRYAITTNGAKPATNDSERPTEGLLQVGAETAREFQAGTVVQFHDVLALEVGLELLDALHVHDGR